MDPLANIIFKVFYTDYTPEELDRQFRKAQNISAHMSLKQRRAWIPLLIDEMLQVGAAETPQEAYKYIEETFKSWPGLDGKIA